METIKNYLDSMFMNLPRTEAVLKAKAELLAMMEDKYNELIADGVAENAAVGTIISEFGNLDDIADDLGIANELKSDYAVEMSDKRLITRDEAKEYVDYKTKSGLFIAIGVFLCIVSVAAPILTDVVAGNNILGTMVMFLIIAAGVGLFVYNGITGRKWKFINKKTCKIDMQTADYLKDEMSRYEKAHAIRIAVGVILCILSVIPIMISKYLSGGYENLATALLFVLVGFGVFLFVYSSSIRGSYETLLGLDGNEMDDLDKKSKVVWANERVGFAMDLFWPVILAIYLCCSFITFKWYCTWIIWPIAGSIYGILKIALKKRS